MSVLCGKFLDKIILGPFIEDPGWDQIIPLLVSHLSLLACPVMITWSKTATES